jgi:hypothetical protein
MAANRAAVGSCSSEASLQRGPALPGRSRPAALHPVRDDADHEQADRPFSSPLLALHVIVGTLLVFAVIYLIAGAVRARIRLTVITSAIGLLSLIAAWVTGSAFAQTGGPGHSMAMGVMTAAALACYLVNVWMAGKYGHEQAAHESVDDNLLLLAW